MDFRVIGRLDVKPPHLVKGIHLEGLRKLGEPHEFAKRYYEQGIDEICYQDIVASLYGRDSIKALLNATAKEVFVPITVGGGIKDVNDALELIRNGADKVSVNSAATRNPGVLSELADSLGRQAVVLTVEAKRWGDSWTAMTDGGREHSHRSVTEWVREGTDRGAGEIFLTSIDREGAGRGFALDLIASVREVTDVPLVAHGGAGSVVDVVAARNAGADAVAIASAFHYTLMDVTEVKEGLAVAGVQVRR